jgi:hypothetical protein
MIRLLLITLFISILPTVAAAEDTLPVSEEMTSTTLLEKIGELQVFKLRVPYTLQRSIKENAQTEKVQSDSCETHAQPHQKGMAVGYSCDPKKTIKQEILHVAAN